MLNLRALHTFVVVAERMNMSRAAEALHISQSALSRQIQTLERDLGIQLFERHGKRLQLTAEGSDLLPRMAALVDQAIDLSARMKAMTRGQVGVLRIAATPQSIEAMLSHVLSRMRKKYPAIEASFVEGPNDTLLEHVRAGIAHVAIASVPPSMDLEKKDLFYGYLYVVLPENHPLTSCEQIEIRDLEATPILALRRGFMTRSLFDAACLEAGTRVRIILDSDSTQTLCALAKADLGVAVVSTTALSQSKGLSVKLLTLGGKPIRGMISATWNPKRYQSPALARFLEEVDDYLHENPPGPPELGISEVQRVNRSEAP